MKLCLITFLKSHNYSIILFEKCLRHNKIKTLTIYQHCIENILSIFGNINTLALTLKTLM